LFAGEQAMARRCRSNMSTGPFNDVTREAELSPRLRGLFALE
jgi:hypothetical protein